jgi:cytochrome d ubiquinol oxidase subunit I
MDSALLIHRLHVAFTVTFHYLFPRLTMGLAPLIVLLKTLGLRSGARIFGINFVIGVVTAIPMEFQFGTNWSHGSWLSGYFIIATDAWMQHPVGYERAPDGSAKQGGGY